MQKPFSPRFYIVSNAIVLCWILIAMALLRANAQEVVTFSRVAEIVVCVASLAGGIFLVAVMGVFWYRAWQTLQDGHARITPSRAVSYMFIPLFNLYWVFQVTLGFCTDHNSYLRRHNLQLSRVPRWPWLISIVLGVVPYAAAFLLPIFMFRAGIVLFYVAVAIQAAIQVVAVSQTALAIDMLRKHAAGEPIPVKPTGWSRKLPWVLVPLMVVVSCTCAILLTKKGYLADGHEIVIAVHDSSAVGGKRQVSIPRSDVETAAAELHVLQQFGDLSPVVQDLAMLHANKIPEATYALLLKNARRAGLHADLSNLAQDLGLNAQELEKSLKTVAESAGVPLSQVQSILMNWLKVRKHCEASVSGGVPTDEEVEHVTRDLTEQVRLRMVRISAGDSIEEVPFPTVVECYAHFERYRNTPAGHPESLDSFDFGYFNPDLASIAYSLSDQNVLLFAAEPTEEVLMQYYESHRDTLKSPAMASAPAEKESPPSASAKPPTYAEARQQIVSIIRKALLRTTQERLLGAVQAEMHRRALTQPSEEDVDAVIRKMIVPADMILKRQISVTGGTRSLAQALTTLAQSADLSAITFPKTTRAGPDLDPEMKVEMPVGQMPLGQALEALCAQAHVSTPGWVQCQAVDGILFAHFVRGMPAEAKQRVIRDLRLKAAMGKALERAKALASAAQSQGLQTAAGKMGLAVKDTELLTRRVIDAPFGQALRIAQVTGQQPSSWLLPPIEIVPSQIPSLELPTVAVGEALLDRVFALADSKAPATEIIPLPARFEVVLVQVLETHSPTPGERQRFRENVVNALKARKHWDAALDWFSIAHASKAMN